MEQKRMNGRVNLLQDQDMTFCLPNNTAQNILRNVA